jgi:8-oxo-dGTP diphosphatase
MWSLIQEGLAAFLLNSLLNKRSSLVQQSLDKKGFFIASPVSIHKLNRGESNLETTPKHIIAVSAFITNENNEVLLTKVQWRMDTWEMPGGQVELGEALDKAVIREVLEETGIGIELVGITGVYYNATKQILSIVFKARYISGEIKIPPEEIYEAKFVKLNVSNIDQYITRPHMKSRTLDAMYAENIIPYETWEVNPYNLLGRLI